MTRSFPVELTSPGEGFHLRPEIPWPAPQHPPGSEASRSDPLLRRPVSSKLFAQTRFRTRNCRAPPHPARLPPVRPARADRASCPREEAARLALRPLGTGRDRPGCPSGTGGTARRREGSAAATSGGRAGPAEELGYFVTAPSTQASLPPLNETPLLRDVQPLHLIKEIALQC